MQVQPPFLCQPPPLPFPLFLEYTLHTSSSSSLFIALGGGYLLRGPPGSNTSYHLSYAYRKKEAFQLQAFRGEKRGGGPLAFEVRKGGGGGGALSSSSEGMKVLLGRAFPPIPLFPTGSFPTPTHYHLSLPLFHNLPVVWQPSSISTSLVGGGSGGGGGGGWTYSLYRVAELHFPQKEAIAHFKVEDWEWKRRGRVLINAAFAHETELILGSLMGIYHIDQGKKKSFAGGVGDFVFDLVT